MFYTIAALASGAVCGALLRWLLSLYLTQTASLALGTLAANWIGAFLIGIAAESILHQQWRLLLITGFLGSLTTFSAFSLEMVGLMQAQRWGAALAGMSLHVFGSFFFTALGIWLMQLGK